MNAPANEQPHLRLRELIAQSGIGVLNQPDNCEAWLRQTCPQSAWEISLLMAALRQGAPAAMIAPNQSIAPQSLRAQLIQRVQTSSGLAADAAAWGVDAWAFILNVNLNPVPAQVQPQVRGNPQPQINVQQPAYAQAQPRAAVQPYVQPQPYIQQQPIVPLHMPEAPGRICPYCGSPAPGQVCPACRRDTTARRRVCSKCGRITPSAEPICLGCGKRYTSDLAWKVPVIVALFIVSLILAMVYLTNS